MCKLLVIRSRMEKVYWVHLTSLIKLITYCPLRVDKKIYGQKPVNRPVHSTATVILKIWTDSYFHWYIWLWHNLFSSSSSFGCSLQGSCHCIIFPNPANPMCCIVTPAFCMFFFYHLWFFSGAGPASSCSNILRQTRFFYRQGLKR